MKDISPIAGPDVYGWDCKLMNVPNAPSVLVVDDQESVRVTVRFILEATGMAGDIREAANGKIAVEMAAAQPPDIILMDVMMPVMDGFEAAKQILAAQPQAKVIMFSAYRSRESMARARELGAAGYLAKPCPHDLLAAAIRDVMAGKHAYPEQAGDA